MSTTLQTIYGAVPAGLPNFAVVSISRCHYSRAKDQEALHAPSSLACSPWLLRLSRTRGSMIPKINIKLDISITAIGVSHRDCSRLFLVKCSWNLSECSPQQLRALPPYPLQARSLASHMLNLTFMMYVHPVNCQSHRSKWYGSSNSLEREIC